MIKEQLDGCMDELLSYILKNGPLDSAEITSRQTNLLELSLIKQHSGLGGT